MSAYILGHLITRLQVEPSVCESKTDLSFKLNLIYYLSLDRGKSVIRPTSQNLPVLDIVTERVRRINAIKLNITKPSHICPSIGMMNT